MRNYSHIACHVSISGKGPIRINNKINLVWSRNIFKMHIISKYDLSNGESRGLKVTVVEDKNIG